MDSLLNCIQLPGNTTVPPNVVLPTSVMLPTSTPNSVELGVAPNEEEQCLRAVVQQIMARNQDSGRYYYCPDCAAKLKQTGQTSYVPIIMVPMYSSDSDYCPQPVKKALDNLVAETKKQDEASKKIDKKQTVKEGKNIQKVNTTVAKSTYF